MSSVLPRIHDLVVHVTPVAVHSNEAMTDLIAMMNTLLDKNGKILIPGVMDDVLPLTKEEHALYSNIDFDIHAFKDQVGTPQLLQNKKVSPRSV